MTYQVFMSAEDRDAELAERDQLRAEVERLRAERDAEKYVAHRDWCRENASAAEFKARAQRYEAALRKAREVLERYQFGDYDDDPGGKNNDDVQEMIARIDAALAEESKP